MGVEGRVMDGARRRRRLIPGVLLAVALVTGCGSIGKPPRSVASFELGAIEARALPPGAVPAVVEVRAPSWLESAQMQYRLAWVEPQQRRSFADSRWIAPPREMLAQALERGLKGAGTAGGSCRLRVELDEFVQDFDSASASTVTLGVRASRLPARGGAVLASRAFQISVPAPSADAAGGARAHRAATQQLVDDIGRWLGALDHDERQGLNTGGRCGQ
ncbi:hypothetical protein dqs_1844 [Azoarcus olearius]|nr:hypothetical protein dqs_1844 [Azoarcus olearius]